jgi:hypothetical protein
MLRLIRSLSILVLAVSASGCLGTVVTAPVGKGRSYGATDAHLILAPSAIDARDCANGLQEVAVYVPLWGVAVGILTLGILVPMNTTFTCAR